MDRPCKQAADFFFYPPLLLIRIRVWEICFRVGGSGPSGDRGRFHRVMITLIQCPGARLEKKETDIALIFWDVTCHRRRTPDLSLDAGDRSWRPHPKVTPSSPALWGVNCGHVALSAPRTRIQSSRSRRTQAFRSFVRFPLPLKGGIPPGQLPRLFSLSLCSVQGPRL